MILTSSGSGSAQKHSTYGIRAAASCTAGKSSRPGVRKLTPITAPTGTASSNSDKGVLFALNMPSAPELATASAKSGVVIPPIPACCSGCRHPNMAVNRVRRVMQRPYADATATASSETRGRTKEAQGQLGEWPLPTITGCRPTPATLHGPRRIRKIRRNPSGQWHQWAQQDNEDAGTSPPVARKWTAGCWSPVRWPTLGSVAIRHKELAE